MTKRDELLGSVVVTTDYLAQWGYTISDKWAAALDEMIIAAKGKGYDPDQPRVPAGESTGGRWTSGDRDYPLPENIQEFMNIWANAKKEASLTVKDGRPLEIVSQGRKATITFTDEQVDQALNADCYHNHPGGQPFSAADLAFCEKTNCASTTVFGIDELTGEKVTWTIQRPDDGWPQDLAYQAKRWDKVGLPAATAKANDIYIKTKNIDQANHESICWLSLYMIDKSGLQVVKSVSN